MISNVNTNLKLAFEVIKNADTIVITAGAGMGVDSGLPDFRGKSGFWKAYPPIEKLGLSFSEMANPVWFKHKPELAWAFYGHRLNLYRNTVPHKGFSILLEICKKKSGGYFVFTSNVDGHFQKAGFSDEYIEECHGSINHFQCSEPCSSKIWTAGEEQIKVDMSTFRAIEPFPLCSKCGSIARPNILMFGDWSWIADRSNAQSFKFSNWLKERYSAKLKIAVIEIGAGVSVPTVRYKSESIASRYGAKLIRINPRDIDIPPGQTSIPLGALEGIESILINS